MCAWAYYGVSVETRGPCVLVLSLHHVSLDWNQAWWQVLALFCFEVSLYSPGWPPNHSCCYPAPLKKKKAKQQQPKGTKFLNCIGLNFKL